MVFPSPLNRFNVNLSDVARNTFAASNVEAAEAEASMVIGESSQTSLSSGNITFHLTPVTFDDNPQTAVCLAALEQQAKQAFEQIGPVMMAQGSVPLPVFPATLAGWLAPIITPINPAESNQVE